MTEMDSPHDLPPGWSWRRVGDIADVSGGGTPKRDEPKFYDGGDIPWATPSDIDPHRVLPLSRTKTSITEAGLRRSSARLLPKGTVLFSSRASIGKIAVAAESLATNQGFANLTPREGVDSWYLAYALKTFTKEVSALGSGTTFLEVAKSSLKEFDLPFPPLPEQRRIVQKIERLLTESRTAREALDRIPPLLNRFRQSILAKTFRGELTERDPEDEPASVLLERIREERRQKWEEDLRARGKDQRKAKYIEPEPPDTSGLPGLPEGWVWVTWGQISPRVTVGHVGPMIHEYVEDGVPFLRSQNVRESGFDPSGLRYISPRFHSRLAKSALTPGDLVVVRSGLPGTTCVIPDSLGEANCADLVVIKKPLGLEPLIGVHYMNFAARDRVRAGSVGIAQRHFNTHSVERLSVPLAPLQEQARIAAMVEALFAEADAIGQAVTNARRQAEHVDQAVLSRAFRGGL